VKWWEHCTQKSLLATALAVVYGGSTVAMYLWAGGVALSRVLLGVHYPGDVVAGALVGSGTALFSYMLLGLT
jgi:undecaprenyl-diphosphatase